MTTARAVAQLDCILSLATVAALNNYTRPVVKSEKGLKIEGGRHPVVERIKTDEKAYFQSLQQSGKWRHIWRVAGQYSNISIFDVESNEELHQLLMSLPLFPYMHIEVMALCRHPSSLHADDR